MLAVTTAVSVSLVTGCSRTPPDPFEETAEQRDKRMEWWREARFGMFIHWGLYAIPAGVWNGERIPGIGEWIMHSAQIPIEEYEPLKDRFNPINFDADAWVRLAKQAGMKYIVITSKHHDGFALWDSDHSDYDIMATPFQRDILEELSDACRRHGLKMCWYHSILDWHHPDYLPRREWETRSAEGADYGRYIDYMKDQLTELLTKFGDIGILWFDGGWEHPSEMHRAEEVIRHVRGLQPDIIINNRIRLPQDYDTPEQYIPATGLPDRDWETCMTMNDTWGYKSWDDNWKSTERLIRNLIDIVSKGGNYLLNVGPTALGEIPEPSIERLEAIGSWMEVNSEAIYGTTASPFHRLDWGRCTKKRDRRGRWTLYLHVFDWPAGGRLTVPGLRSEIRHAFLLSDSRENPLAVSHDGESVVVTVPDEAPDEIAPVVVLKLDGELDVAPYVIRETAGGSVELNAMDANIHGERARIEQRGGANIGYWTNPNDWASWDYTVERSGEFQVEITYSCPAETAGTSFSVTSAGRILTGIVGSTASWRDYTTARLGSITIAAAGSYTLEIRPTSQPQNAVMNLRSIVLKRVR